MQRESYKCLSPRKHGVSLSSHTWNCSSDQSKALMEISQSDITPTLAAGQHGFLSALCFSTFCHFKVNLPLQIWISLMFVPPFPGSCCVSTDYQCNTSNKTHQPTIFPPSAVHFICTGWVRVKGKKKDRGVCLNKFVQSYSNVHLKHGNVFCFRGKRKGESATCRVGGLILKLKVISCVYL